MSPTPEAGAKRTARPFSIYRPSSAGASPCLWCLPSADATADTTMAALRVPYLWYTSVKSQIMDRAGCDICDGDDLGHASSSPATACCCSCHFEESR